MPLLWLSLAFLSGILMAGWSGLRWEAWCAGLALCLLLGWALLRLGRGWLRAIVRRHHELKFAPLLLLAAMCAGGLRYALAHLPPGPSDLAYYNGTGEMVLVGWVSGDPSRRESVTLLRVQVDAFFAGKVRMPLRGAVQVMLPSGITLEYGDRVWLTGKPVQPPESEEFSYRDFLAGQGVSSYLAYPRVTLNQGRGGVPFLRGLYALRQRGTQVLERLYPAPEAQLLQGILLGVDEGIPAEVVKNFQTTGIAHVVAISGFNMSILCTLFMGLFNRVLSRWWAALAAGLALGAYTLLVGGGPAVVRAAVMCSLALIAGQLGRAAGGVNALGLAAGVMCLIDPNLLWDAGFQLSFAATLGLLLYTGPLQSWFRRLADAWMPAGWGSRVAGPVGEYLLCTLAAQATTLPVIAWHFQRLSLSSLLANPLVLPAQPPLMILSGLSLLAGFVLEPLARLLAWTAWPFAAWTIGVASLLARLPLSELVLGSFGVRILLSGCILVLAAAALREKLGRLRPVLILLPLAGLAIFSARLAFSAPDGRYHLVIFDLPGGPALLVRDPHGAALLIGGTDSGITLEDRLGRWLPPSARLEALIVPAWAGQKGLPRLVERFRPVKILLCPDARGLRSGLESAARGSGIELAAIGAGRELDWGPFSLAVRDAPAGDCTLSLRYGGFSLFVPEPGSPADLVQTADGEWVLRGAGEEGERILAPPSGGWLHIQTDGERLWVESGR